MIFLSAKKKIKSLLLNPDPKSKNAPLLICLRGTPSTGQKLIQLGFHPFCDLRMLIK